MKKSIEIDRSKLSEWLKDESSQSAIQQSEDALINYVAAFAVHPDPGLREKILNKIRSLQSSHENRQVLSLDHLPVLDTSSNWLDWQEVVKDIQPPQEFDGVYLHTLESSPHRELFVAWVKEYVEEEVHTDLLESFILLEGTCECHITDTEGNARVVRMGTGDFITMQIGEVHDIIITSLTPAKAILQWMKLSA